MKRTIVILALVTAFVLAFTAVAQATWRGFTPTRPAIEAAPTIPGTIPATIPNPAPGAPGHVAGTPPATIPNPDVGEPGHDPGEAVGDPIPNPPLGQPGHDPGIPETIPNPAAGAPGHVPAPALPNPDFVGLHGFLSFPEARREMQRNFSADGEFGPGDPGVNLQGTAHGGYVTTTTKCVVCHSAHRATGIPEGTPGIWNQYFLTAGSTTCVACHVAGSAQASRLLVEWGGPWGNYTSGGPHAAPRRGCTMCHNAGIHGLSTSQFNVLNAFMLGNTRRPGEAWCADHVNPGEGNGNCPNCGTPGSGAADSNNNPGAGPGPGTGTATGLPTGTANNGLTRDQQIIYEIERIVGPNIASPWPAGTTLANRTAANMTVFNAQTWWANGFRTVPEMGGFPGAVPNVNPAVAPGATVNVSGAVYGAARSLATSVTCGESGCHAVGAFFNVTWGQGYDRRTGMGVNAGNETINLGGGQSIGVRQMVTGHVMPSVRSTGTGTDGLGAACGPCHGGNPAGFPTASTIPGIADLSRRAYGCDQCHDMVGVATNTTAWPHGNRHIFVYEWFDGEQEENWMLAGNLWMYAGNIARSNTGPVVTAGTFTGPAGPIGTPLPETHPSYPGNWTLALGGIPIANNPGVTGFPFGPNRNAADTAYLRGGPVFQGPNSNNPTFADQNWFVMTNVGSGRYGVPSDVPANNWGTGLIDGSCLKCHVALDPASFNAIGHMGADALRHAWRATTSNATNPTSPTGTQLATGNALNPGWTGLPLNNDSTRLFLYR